MAMKACQDNGYEVDPEIVEFFTKHRKPIMRVYSTLTPLR